MKNVDLLRDRNALNKFTTRLKSLVCKARMRGEGNSVIVRTRSGYLMDITHYREPKISDCAVIQFEGKFGDRMYVWNADGSCVTSSDFDIIEIVK